MNLQAEIVETTFSDKQKPCFLIVIGQTNGIL